MSSLAPLHRSDTDLFAALARSGLRAAAGLLLAFAVLLALPLQAQTLTTLVSNTGETLESGFTDFIVAQSFRTGANADGYTISEVDIRLKLVSGSTSVSIRKNASGEPGDLVAALTNPGNLSPNSRNTFTAPVGTRLDGARTTYWITVSEGISNRVQLAFTTSDDQSGAQGWRIGNDRLYRSSDLESWINSESALVIAIKGTAGITATNATGQPSISGTAQVGQTLTAGIGDIADAEDLPSTVFPAGYTFQWVRVDSSNNETDVGTDSSTYSPTSSDVGSTIKVKVSFIDNAGNPEGPLPSDAYPSEPPGATVVAAQGSCPSDNDWCATLTMGYDSFSGGQARFHDFGFISSSNFGVLNPTMFTHGPTAYTVTNVYRLLSTSLNGNTILTDSLSLTVSGGTLPDGAVLNVGGTEFTVGTDSATSTAGQENWNLQALGISFAWVEDQKVSVSLKNLTPPVLQSAYTGLAFGQNQRLILEFDQNLDVTDGGLPPVSSFTIVASGDTLPLANVRSSGDRGVRIDLIYLNNFIFRAGEQITVSYVDPTSGDDIAALQGSTGQDVASFTGISVTNNSTILPVTPASPPRNLVATANGKTSISLAWDPPVRNGGSPITGYSVQRGASDAGPWVLVTDDEGGTGTADTTFEDSGLSPGTTYYYRLGAINAIGGTLTSETVGGTAVSKVASATTLAGPAARGQPAISGTAQVGQMLTATTSGITDPDGNTKAENGDAGYAYTYQWILVDGNTETDISGETSSTYTPVTADVGKTIKVRVSFTDDLNNAEGPLTSDATAAVTAASSSDASLFALALAESGGATISLTPGFAPGTTTYTALVANTVGRITLTESTTDANASVAYLDGDGTALTDLNTVADGHQVDLVAGANVIQVKVTAEDTTTTQTYRVTVTRTALVCTAPDLSGGTEVWTGTLTVGTDAGIYGYESVSPAFGALSNTGFDYGGNDYTIEAINRFDLGTSEFLRLDLDSSFPESDRGKLRLHVCGESFELGSNVVQDNLLNTYAWLTNLGWPAALDWSGATTVLLALSEAPNAVPVFGEDPSAVREVAENTAAGTDIGVAVSATDAENDSLEYSLGGTDAASFDIVLATGQLRTKTGVDYNHEASKNSYSVTVEADDGNSNTATIAVTVNVTDVDEKSARPTIPTVTARPGTTDSLDVSWTKPDLAGGPDIVGYNLRYKVTGSGSWTTEQLTGTGLTEMISGLQAGTGYTVQVQTRNGETPSLWSLDGQGSTATTTTNTAATGTPGISGTAQVGQTLTASTIGIMDDDGLPASFTYQWVRVGADGTSNETNIGSNATYTPSSSDVGNRIKVKVSFIDNAGYPEGPLPSDAYPSEPPGATVVAAQGSCPSDNDWCATLTMGYDPYSGGQARFHDFGFISSSNFGVLNPTMFTHGPTAYTVTNVYRLLSTSLNGNTILTDSLSLTVSGGTLPDGAVLNVGGTELTVGTDSATSTAGQENWNLQALGISFAWVEDQKVSVSLKFPTPPVLQSAYTGLAFGQNQRLILEFDQNLDVTDGGLPPVSSFTIVASGDTLPLANVRSSGDRGVRIDLIYLNNFIFRAGEQITVSYVDPTSGDDDAALQGSNGQDVASFTGFSVTNNSTVAPVTPASPPRNLVATANGKTSISLAWDPPVRNGGSPITGYSVQRGASDAGPWVLVTDDEGGTGTADTTFEDSGLSPGTTYYYRLGAINAIGGTLTSETVGGTAVSKVASATTLAGPAATGQPAIEGTAQVGQMLTATTSGISDPDGNTKAENGDAGYAYTYQWVRVDGGTDSEISGETSNAYTLMADDIGKTVKVKVSFTDDAGNDEGPLISDAYPSSGTIATAGICARTPEVRDELVSLISGVDDCAGVTATHLADIIEIDLSRSSIADLKAGDFAGLTALTDLSLAGNSLASLPAGVFAGLTALTSLDLDNNSLASLPAGVFDGLTSLGTLYVSDNELASLRDNVFDDLTSLGALTLDGNELASLLAGLFDSLTLLTSLSLDGNELTSLPAGLFDRLTALTRLTLADNELASLRGDVFADLTSLSILTLNGNALNMLPNDVFADLTRLTTLWLQDNPGMPFKPTAVALPDDGTVSDAGGMVTLDGSGSGGAWGTNVTYSWVLTPTTNGVTFDDNTSATPEVTIPALAANTELIFTLTVTGKGGTSGIDTDTDTATVTVTGTTSTDATLSALTVNDGTTDHTIDLATTPYTLDVGNAVTTVTLTATPTHTGASVSEVTLGGNAIADTDFTDGITVPSLAEGANVIVVTVTAQDGSTTQPYTVTVTWTGIPVTIEAEHESIGGGVEDLKYTLTRTGATTDALTVTVTLTQDQNWLTSTDLTHEVEFAAGEATKDLIIEDSRFSFDPTTSDNLVATVTGTGVAGGTDTVVVISIADPPITLAFDQDAYTFPEGGPADDVEIYVTATLDAAFTRRPSSMFSIAIGTGEGTATAPEDYGTVLRLPSFNPTDFTANSDGQQAASLLFGPSAGNPLVIVDDDVYEVNEAFNVKIETTPLWRTGLARVKKTDGTFCTLGPSGCFSVSYPVTITDDLDLPRNTVPTATDSLVTTDEDTAHHFAASEFNFDDTDTDDTLASVTVVTLPTVGALEFDGTAVTAGQVVDEADIGKLVFTPVLNANGTDYASFTFKVSDGTEESAADYSMTVNVTAVNDAATGTPMIMGTAQVGQELTAGQGNIADADGLPATFPGDYTYQWVRVDADGVSNVTNIGSDSITYTPLAADEGKKVKVKVSFTDDDGTTETVTSDAYPASGTIMPGTSTNSAPTATDSSVTTDEDTAHHFAASEFNFDDTDAGDTLASVTVVTPPAVGALTLDGTAVTAGQVVDEADIGKLVFTPVLNANGTDYASFTFRVSDGTDESAADYIMTVNVTAVNDAATGTPMIEGTAQVGQELTAGQGNIADADGLPATFPGDYTYQWVRVDADGVSNVTNIGSDSDTYTLMAADVGKKIRVKVSFNDDGGTTETRTSDAYPSGVGTIVAANTAPTATDSSVTTDEDTAHHFAASEFNFDDTDIGDMLASVTVVTLPTAGALEFDGMAVTTGQVVDEADIGKLVFTPVLNANGTDYASFTFKVSDGTDESAADYSMTVNVTAVNDDATGKPMIEGTAQAGETLMAGTSGIMDADGLSASFTYQWVRVDSDGTSNEMDIGSNSDTYTLMADDVGKKVKVKVTFTDNGGTTETVTSDAYPSGVGTIVAANTAPTATDSLVTTDEDTAHHFAASEFNFDDIDAGDTLASVTVVTLPVAGALALDGTAVTAGKVVEAVDIGKLVFTPVLNANGTSYASFTFRVSDGTDESAADYSMTVNVTAVNDDATGKPTITGTAQVGEILTASTSGISDNDGLINVSFTYQWVRVDSDGTSNEMDIGSNSDTYTLMADDVGKKVKVKVTFTDNGGTTETVTSDVYPASGTITPGTPTNTVPTATDSLVTTDEDTAHHFAASEFNFNDTDAGDTLASVTVVTLPAVGALALNSTAVTAGDTVTKSQLDANQLTFMPAADGNGDAYASFTFRVSDGTDESAADYSMTVNVTAVNDDATGKPTITGTAQVGEILTASTSGISDNDGLTNVSFTYQWVRVDSDGTSNEMDIGSNSDTYTLMADDEGKKVKVKVTFNDNGGTTETVTSDVYPASGTITPGTPTNTAPTATDSLVTTDEDTAHHFAASEFNFNDTDAGDTLASVTVVTLPAVGALALDGTAVTAGDTVTKSQLDANQLTFMPAADGNGDAYASFTFRVSDGTDESAADYSMTVNVTAVNDDATGKPTIMGTSQVGETLMAGTPDIMDADGLPSSFTYQWVRVDSDGTSNEMDIGTNSDTYTLMAADVGKKVKVKVTFTDNGGTTETVTSDVYPASGTITPGTPTNTVPTATDSLVTTDEDTAHHFAASEFNFNDTDAGDTLASVTVVTLPAAGALALDGTAVTAGKVVEAEDIGKLVFTPAQDANGTSYASFTFRVSDGTDESVADYSMTVNVTAVNDDATGKPTIEGTAQAGQDLTAHTDGISDPDGKTKAENGDADYAYTYQWIRVDGATDSEISGETSRAYTLMADDIGKKVKVKVTFTDNGGTTETVTSDAYPSSGTIATAGICDRTPAVRDELVSLISGVDDCVGVTATHLANITSIDLSSQSIADLKAGDFAGLTALMELNLAGNSLTSLPAGVFDGLTSLTSLSLDDNGLESLHDDVFADLTSLTLLTLNDNALNMLPNDVFKPLTELTTLWLQDNPGMPFKPTADALPDDGTVSDEGGTVTLDGSGSGGAWGTNVTYSWVLTPTTNGVTFDDNTSATPEVSIPALAADTTLTFTLTVTGSGGTSGIDTDTDTATVTVTETTTTSTDATLSGLTLQDGEGTVITLSPTFPSDTTTDYTASVANGVEAVVLTATQNDSTATVAIANDDDTSKPGEAQLDLIVGTNTLTVTVTAEVGSTTKTYTITVTREVAQTTNTAATGKPTIMGTAQVGQMLTAGTSGIMDADGVAASFTYQWVRVDSDGVSNETDVGSNSSNYTLLAADEGKKVKVKVSFIDNANNAEGPLASDAYPASGMIGPGTATAAGVTVTETALTVAEEDTDGDSYTVVLDTEPTADVTVTVGGHSGTDVTPYPATLMFTVLNWDTARTVTVTAGDDADTANDSVTLTHSATSADSNYSGIVIAEVAVTVNDNDTAQVTGVSVAPGNTQLAVSWTAVDNATGYKVQWKSGSEGYNTGDRQAAVTSGSTTNHTILNLNNGTEYTVQVIATRTGANDGPPSTEMTSVSTTASVTVSKTALAVAEEDTTGDSYTVVLDTRPTASVTVTVGGHSGTDVTPYPATLMFTVLNWDTARTVTVTAGDDVDTANDTVLLTHSATSTDRNYRGIVIAEVTVTVNDNDTARVTVVTGVHLASGPGPDGVWRAGDTVEAVVEFSEAVTVDTSGGEPALAIEFGAQRREAVYARGSGTAALVFHHVVVAADDGARAARVVAGGLSLNGATIRNAAGVDAVLGFVLAPAVTSVAVAPDPDGDGRWSPGEAVTVTVGFSDEVAVDTSGGTPSVAVLAGGGEREAVYSTGSGTATLRFAYTVLADDGAVTSVQAPANGLALNGGAIVGPTGLAAALAHVGASRTGTPAAPALSVADASVAEGGTLVFAVTLDRAAAAVVVVGWATGDGTARAGEDYAADSGKIAFVPGETLRTVRVAVLEDDEAEGAETMELTLSNATGAGLDDATATGRLSDPAGEQPAVSVADAKVRESPGAVLAFKVTLDRVSRETATVDWETLNGGGKAGAKAGQDYVADSGTLVFVPGETAKTVNVAVLDDSHDEGQEVMLVVLSNAVRATIADGAAKGIIENSDHMPKAWLARFGRTVAEQVLDAVEDRLRAPPHAGVEARLVGEALPLWDGGSRPGGLDRPSSGEDAGDAAALTDWLRDDPDPWSGADSGDGRWLTLRSRAVTSRDFLTGTSFAMTKEAAGGAGLVSLWGRGALTRFDGRERGPNGDLTLEGEVGSAMLGADWTSGTGFRSDSGAGAWTAGLLLAHSRGEGSYRGEVDGDGDTGGTEGAVLSSVTGLYPYGRYRVTDRVTLWGVAGYGAGTLTLTPQDADGKAVAPLRTDMELMMAALGLRGVAIEAPSDGGFELAGTSDAMVVRTSSEKTSGLVAATGDVTRLRLGLEGVWRGLAFGGHELEPSLEVGIRHDGGDAETGFGVDIGAGLAWSHANSGVSAEVSARGLLTHAAGGFREQGIAGSLTWDPRPETERGALLTLRQTMGAQASGGMDALLGHTTLAGLTANDDDDELQNRRLELKLGYGFPVFSDRFTSTPEIELGFSDRARDYSLGWRLTLARRAAGTLELGVVATRREHANDEPRHVIGFQLTARW